MGDAVTFDYAAETEALGARLDELERQALEAERSGQGADGLLSQIRATRAEWERLGGPRALQVDIPAGSSRTEQTEAVVAAVVAQLNKEEKSDG